MRSLTRSAATLAGLAKDLDATALARQIAAKTTGRWPPLPLSLAPAKRPKGARRTAPQRERPLLLATATGLQRDGAPMSQHELVAGLNTRGWDVAVMTAKDGPLRARYEALGVACVVDAGLSPSPSVASAYENGVAALSETLGRLAPDLVFASTVDCFPVVDAARMAGLPSVWNIRESEPWRTRLADRNPKIAARALACFNYPEAVIFVADASRRNWAPFCDPSRASVIYNAPAPFDAPAGRAALRRKFGWGDTETVLLSLGAVCARKGQEDLAAALNILPSETLRGVKAVFAGRAPDATYVAAVNTAMSEAARARCVFAGSVDNPLDYLAAADILVNTSRSEAFPRVFLEAASVRTPIIATPVDGAVERLHDKISAWFYPPGDAGALAEAVSALCSSSAHRRRLADGAYAALVEQWSYEDMISAYDSELNRALGGRDA